MKIDQELLNIRVMRKDDIEAVVDIDAKVFGAERMDYYERKISMILDRKGSIATSLVADYNNQVIGFVMGNIFTGEFGIPQKTASLDTIGIDPDFSGQGLGTQLLDEFENHLRKAGVENIQTLVDRGNIPLSKFFNKSGFAPSQTINLEKSI
ncbi:MAG: GNAT family N-acetyltransferase [Thermoplasmata archaeon]|nr:MAG: GNAT family N-acetyltransferase [Thermoplasmata archaeon]